jgi:hypothetical protein
MNIREYIDELENSDHNNSDLTTEKKGDSIWPWWNGKERDNTKNAEILLQLEESMALWSN